ncbi:MAG: chemotaxis protein CheW [Mitsuaria chitosanitabida]|jgi:hypothetical protein|uniref:chemotaxis protein CheW n=1 Tax=Roseateles chitosanitabidus TaxID=65048 RepID=UPI001B171EB2|nr:chemotaxis protein CheW [Roseateles chitosanitabidus]MBO9689841.1 chemotaxis protein CheW [Roseateles chitosanitabidus]
MTEEIRRQLRDWRETFDRGFAEPRRHRADDATFDVLGIRIAGAAFALDLADLAGLLPAMPPVPYPATAPGLLGLIGHQGQVLPLYDLQTLIGRGAAPAVHWWAVARAAPLALAFEGFEGQWRIAASERLQQSDAAGTGWAVRCGGALRPLIALDDVIATVTGRLASTPGLDDTTTADPIGS